MSDRYQSVRAKRRRAAAKALELRQHLDVYLDGNPIEAEPVVRGRTVDIVARVHERVPEECSLLLGELAHDLRSALDHLVYAHMEDPQDRLGCQFPSWRKAEPPTPEQWRKRVEAAIPGAASERLRAQVAGLQPFSGGRDEALWTLTELDNIDKHRVLLGVAASIHATRQVTQGQFVTERDVAAGRYPDGLLLQLTVTSDGSLSHPFIKNPTVADMFRDPQLDVVYQDPNAAPIEDGAVILTLKAHEWQEVTTYEPQFTVVLSQPPFQGRVVLDEVEAITLRVGELVDRLTGRQRK